MRISSFLILLPVLSLALVSSAPAQVPPAEQLLPDDTIAVVTIPDWQKMRQQSEQSPWSKLWEDPTMKRFTDNFWTNFQKDFLQPLERETGVNLLEQRVLLQGQVTFALTPPLEDSQDMFGFLLLIDTKEKSEQLTSLLESVKKKWLEQGDELKSEKIRGVEFNSITVSGADIDSLLQRIFPQAEPVGEDEVGEPKKVNLRIGRHQSLLIVGENPQAIEKILARQAGGLVQPLADRPGFQKVQQQLFRDSLGFGWINVQPIYSHLMKGLAAQQQEEPPPGMPNFGFDKFLPALGFDGLESISASMTSNQGSTSVDFLVGVPESKRAGLFKIFTFESKDAAPPAFVPAAAFRFQRLRLDLQKAWAGLETMLAQIDPSIAGMLQLMLSSAGKEQDPNFDLKKNLIGNLGDDVITYQKPPDSATTGDAANPPTLILIGSPQPEQLADAVRLIMSLMPPPLSSAPLKEREFLGKKIYSINTMAPTVPGETADASAPGTATLSFAASAGYLAFSTDNATLEEYLRSAESTGKKLRETAGLGEAIEKVGGADTGYFSFEDQVETWRTLFKTVKADPEAFTKSLSLATGETAEQPRLTRWIDVTLLPEFSAIEKYFSIALVSGNVRPEGYLFKVYSPYPSGGE